MCSPVINIYKVVRLPIEWKTAIAISLKKGDKSSISTKLLPSHFDIGSQFDKVFESIGINCS